MRSVTYAYLGASDEAGRFAKKGTATDIVLYNAKQAEAHLNIVTPARYPERIHGLLAALDLADRIVLHPTALDRSLGEIIVGCELFGKTRGLARALGGVDAEQLRNLLSKTALKGLEVTEESDALLRERLYEPATMSKDGKLVLPIDHAFPVKGIGTVLLGLVRSGELAAHQDLQLYPTTKTIQVRSVQVHDVDHKAAPAGSRVGLAIKGAEPDEAGRGRILAPAGSLHVVPAEMPITFEVEASAFSKWVPRDGSVLHLFHVLQQTVLRVETAKADGPGRIQIQGRLEQPVTHVPNQPVVLVDLDNKIQRFVGRTHLPTS
jgi:selenocysteine-specific translation elongation factor